MKSLPHFDRTARISRTAHSSFLLTAARGTKVPKEVLPPLSPLSFKERRRRARELGICQSVPLLTVLLPTKKEETAAHLLRAAARLIKGACDTLLLLCTDDLPLSIRRLASLLGIADHLRTFPTDRLDAVLPLTSVYTLCTEEKAAIRAAGRCMSLGIPVLGLRGEGALPPSASLPLGMLSPYGDPHSLAEAWRSLLADPPFRQSASLAAVARYRSRFLPALPEGRPASSSEETEG